MPIQVSCRFLCFLPISSWMRWHKHGLVAAKYSFKSVASKGLILAHVEMNFFRLAGTLVSVWKNSTLFAVRWQQKSKCHYIKFSISNFFLQIVIYSTGLSLTFLLAINYKLFMNNNYTSLMFWTVISENL